jgi:hypothetical protein
MRKGYGFEYKVKQMLKNEGFIPFKLAINSYADFLALKIENGVVTQAKLVECKTHRIRKKNPTGKWYLHEREKKQLETLMIFFIKYKIPVFYYNREGGVLRIQKLSEVYDKYMR